MRLLREKKYCIFCNKRHIDEFRLFYLIIFIFALITILIIKDVIRVAPLKMRNNMAIKKFSCIMERTDQYIIEIDEEIIKPEYGK